MNKQIDQINSEKTFLRQKISQIENDYYRQKKENSKEQTQSKLFQTMVKRYETGSEFFGRTRGKSSNTKTSANMFRILPDVD